MQYNNFNGFSNSFSLRFVLTNGNGSLHACYSLTDLRPKLEVDFYFYLFISQVGFSNKNNIFKFTSVIRYSFTQ